MDAEDAEDLIRSWQMEYEYHAAKGLRKVAKGKMMNKKRQEW
jgi:hypothetical protein